MENNIPAVVEALYRYFVTDFWPDYFRGDPINGHGIWAFYQGLQLGMQMTDACLEKL